MKAGQISSPSFPLHHTAKNLFQKECCHCVCLVYDQCVYTTSPIILFHNKSILSGQMTHVHSLAPLKEIYIRCAINV